jgi:hypothetical protein
MVMANTWELQSSAYCLLHTGFLPALLFDREDGADMFLCSAYDFQ